MSQSWWVRLVVTLLLLLGGSAQLVWTIGGWDTEADLARKAAARDLGEDPGEDVPAPGWARIFPERKVSLGLDLQGGIDILLEVELTEVIEGQASRTAEAITRAMEDEGLTGVAAERAEGGRVEVAIPSEADEDFVRGWVRDNYTSLAYLGVVDGRHQYEFATEIRDQMRSNALDQVIETLRNRVDEFGVAEPVIVPKGQSRVNIQLPGLKDPDRARKLIGETAQLQFRLVHESVDDIQWRSWWSQAQDALGEDATDEEINDFLADRLPADHEILFQWEIDENGDKQRIRPWLVQNRVELTGELIEYASQAWDQFNRPYVRVEFNLEGRRVFGDLTTEHTRRLMAIVLDGQVRSAPRIREPITGGVASIEMGSGDSVSLVQDAHDLAIVLRAGALPAPVYIEEERTVGPSLGADSIRRGLTAIIIGGLAVIVFMLVYYKSHGLIANIALAVNVILLWAALVMLGATVTLPGLAGIILTIGMAVDANVIIFERIREERRVGKSLRSAVNSGYAQAFSTIMDANITTLLAGVVLYSYGSGPVKGFAVTLMIGIITSVFSAIVVSRLVLEYLIEGRGVRRLSI